MDQKKFLVLIGALVWLFSMIIVYFSPRFDMVTLFLFSSYPYLSY